MCGIVGYSGHTLDERALLRAVHSLRHRGPDGDGVYIGEGADVGLGHARLSIIDLQTGGQPLFSEERDVVLVCNGEIYDFERIHAELEGQGHRFSTRSDSEIIIHLYQEHGLRFVDHLRGEFAFLLHDARAQRLLAVRDRFGIKPLFFNKQGGAYLFASEAKAIFATGLLEPAIDPLAIRNYLSGVMPNSIFEHIDVVPPGCFLNVNLSTGSHETVRYWDLDLPPDGDTEGRGHHEHVASVRESVEEAVRMRMRADVPVGVYLSGGIDSAIVAALAAKSRPGALKAFTISFPGSAEYDELAIARNMADKVGVELHAVSCSDEALLKDTEESLWVAELPFPNFHGVGKFMLSRLAREHVKVVLTGEGSDETFLGYAYFKPGRGGASDQIGGRVTPLRKLHARRARAIVDALGFVPLPEHVLTFSPWQQGRIRGLFTKSSRARLKSNHPLKQLVKGMDRAQTDGRSVARRIQYFSIKLILAPYLLTLLGDRAELSHSLEGRTPFLDHHVFENARAIPDQLKIRNGVEKYVLREAFKDELTEELYARKKWPYLAPPLWISKGRSPELDRMIAAYLSKEAIERCGIFSHRAVRRVLVLQRMIPFDCHLKRVLNIALTICLTVQILDAQYVQDFEGNLQKHAATPFQPIV